MFDDIFNWLAMLITIIIGFSIGFTLLGQVIIHQNDSLYTNDDNCTDTIFERMAHLDEMDYSKYRL